MQVPLYQGKKKMNMKIDTFLEGSFHVWNQCECV